MRSLPPGPALSLFTRLRYLKDPYELLWDCRRKYGRTFTLVTTAQTVVTGTPEGARAIFTAKTECFKVNLTPAQLLILGEHSMTNNSGKEHRRQRSIVAPPFRGEAMRDLAGVMQAAARRALDAWPAGERRIMHEVAVEAALDIILQAIFGVDDARLTQARAAVRGFTHAFSSPGFLFVSLFHLNGLNVGPQARFSRARAELDRLMQEMIRERRERPEAQRIDILSHLLKARYADDGSPMRDEEVRDNLVTNLVAGHETSAVTLTWALYWLSRQPEVRERLEAELDALGPDPEAHAFANLPYLKAVIQETMRLWPVVPDVVRQLALPLEVDGYLVPAEMQVAASPALIHYDEELYPEPERFRPERFLDRAYSSYEYLPFGGGDRKCIGSYFAVFEAAIVLGTLLHRARFKPGSDAPLRVSRRGFLMAPTDGVPLIREDRRPVAAAEQALNPR